MPPWRSILIGLFACLLLGVPARAGQAPAPDPQSWALLLAGLALLAIATRQRQRDFDNR